LSKQINVIKDAAGTLLSMFQSSKMPEAIVFTIINKDPSWDQPSYHWSIGNQILMLSNDTTDARGFRQWGNVDRNVSKGTRAIYILAPMTRPVEDTKKPAEKVQPIIGFRPIPVFRVEDTEGRPLNKPNYQPPQLPPFWEVADYLGITIEYQPISAAYLGKFNRGNNKITLCAKDSFVYFHELAHAVHNTLTPLTKANVAKNEIVAELTAAVLCKLQGIEGYESGCYDYVKHYCRDKDPQAVVKSIMGLLSEVEQVTQKIISISEEIDRTRQTKLSS